MKMTKRILAIVMAVVTLVSVMGIAAEAAGAYVGKLNLGYMAPTNSKGTKTIETVKLYGDYDYINFYINSKKKNSYFAYEICSDKDYTKVVGGNIISCDKGTYTFTDKIKLKGNFKSKTYYMVTYAFKMYSDGSIEIDQNSMCEFKVVVKRTADFDDKVVVLKETKNTTKGAYIKWGKLSGANKYYIYRRSITGTKWKKVGSVSSKKVSFTDTSVKSKNGNYIYSVKAINKKGKASRYLYSGLTCLFAKTPTMKSIEVAKDNVVEIKWDSTSSSAKYNIMRKEGSGSWKTIKTNYTGTSYKDTTATSGKKYAYSVKAVISTKYGKATSSYYANSDKAVTYLEAPYVEAVSAVENGVSIKWLPVKGSVSYSIFRKPFNGSTGWKKIDEVGADAKSYVDTTASITNGKYLYSVRSNAKTNKGSYEYAGRPYLVLQNPKFEVKESAGEYYLYWKEVPNANKYIVYSRNPGGVWQENVAYGPGFNSLELHFPSVGEREFAVAARYQHYSTLFRKYHSIYSDYENNTVTLVDYPDLSPSYNLHKDKIRLYWSDLGAEGYNVYKTSDENAEPQLIASLTAEELEYIDTAVEVNVQYTYVVKGIYNGIEQTEGVHPCNIKIYPEDSITEKINIYYVNNSSSGYDGLRVAGDIENAVFYIYEEDNATWKRFYLFDVYGEEGKEYAYTWANFDSNGKIKVGVSFLRENGATAIDDYILELDSYKPQTTITQTCTKNGVKITLNPDSEAVSYRMRTTYDLLDKDVVVDVSDGNAVTHTFKATEMNEEGTGIKYGFIDVHAKRGDGSRTGKSFELRFVATPNLVDAKKNSDGYPVVKWSKPNINSDSTMHIYRKAPDGEWECIKSVKTSSLKTKKFSGYSSYNYYFVDKTAKAGVKYTYSVQQEVSVRDIPTKSYLNKTGVTTN